MTERIEDPEKARAMAEAGDDDRSQAALVRASARVARHWPKPTSEEDPDGRMREWQDQHRDRLDMDAESLDAIADMEEDRVGRKFDEERQAHQIQDPDKARAMADAEDPYREQAQEDFRRASEWANAGEQHSANAANRFGMHSLSDAAEAAEESGREYDDERARQAAERIIEPGAKNS